MTIVIFIITLALLFDYINGFHDAANSIATIIATKVLKPWQAALWGAAFNFLGFFVFPLHVAETISEGIVVNEFISNASLAAVLIAAIIFNLSTWWLKLPSSSSHALIGGLIGIGLFQAGLTALHWPMIMLIIISIFISPLMGMLIAYALVKLIPHLTHREENKKSYKILQLFSSALLSLGHGGNDAQKTMGVIALLLYINGYTEGDFHVPMWVVLSCYLMIALGTLSGGKRIVETVGYKITKLHPPTGACAEFGSAFTLMIANQFGIPVSTTYVVTGAVVGVSSYNSAKFRSTNWLIVKQIFLAWIVTMPTTAIIAGTFFWLIKSFQ